MTLITRETIELNAPGRPRVVAYRLRDLAVHSSGGLRWTITHLPSGLNFGFYWTTSAEARWVMKKMYELTPAWGQLKPDDIERIGPALFKLFAENGARRLNTMPRAFRPGGPFNGY